jgi:C1A family cysteine protease
MSSTLRIYNYKKATPDTRDLKFNVQLRLTAKQHLPIAYDLRTIYSKFIPAVLDQGSLGASSVNACSNALLFLLRKEKLKDWQPSRLYMYWFSRFIEGTTNEDSGVSIRSVMTAIHTYGVCDEALLPYNVNKYKIQPSHSTVRAATPHTRNFKYLSIDPSLVLIKQCLHMGFPIVFSMDVYESFENHHVAHTGIVPMPNEAIESCLGGHVATIYGYDDAKKHFIVMNSWGGAWGDKGYFYLPYDYLKYMSDLWTMKFFE